jgi:hypothetical protein
MLSTAFQKTLKRTCPTNPDEEVLLKNALHLAEKDMVRYGGVET